MSRRSHRRPPVVSLVIAVVVVIVWAIVRLVIFETTMFPLTYVLPLLICIWSRDRVALWGMAAVFAALHLTKLFVILPDRALAPDELWSNAIATLANLVIGAFAVDAIIRLRWRLEAALTDVHTQAEELRQQSEELAQQNEELTEQAEELSRQTTELSDQGEELADQNEELQSQSEEIHALNAALEQRERLLDTLLEATRSAGSEQMALRHIVRAAPGLFGDVCAAAAIYEQTSSGLRLWALATDASEDDDGAETAILEDAFALLILDQNRTAALNDTSRRPDLSVPVLPGRVPIRAVLGAPVRVAERPAGVFAIYCTREHDWSDEQFRLAEWIEASKPDVESAGHTLSVALPAEPLWIEADEDRIAQVVTNLLTNAARYTPPGGRITVSVAHSGHEAVLSVTDTGAGLHPDDVDRVFDMFTQVGGPGSGGLGIGLAIVRGIAELHGGRAEVRSDGLGRGSEFRVALPLNTLPHHDDNTISPAARSVHASPRRVLVVDDNTDATEMMAALLEMHGHTVWIAHDGHTALALADQIAPEVALLDIGLPGLDGYELARRLRQADGTRQARLVAVTGWGQDGDRAKARDAGFDAHLTKPAAPHDILAVLAAEPTGAVS